MNFFNIIFSFLILSFLITITSSFYIFDDEELKERQITIESLTNIREDFYMVNYKNDYYLEELLKKGGKGILEIYNYFYSKFGNYYDINIKPSQKDFSCSSFNVLNKNDRNLFGRNFDYQHSPSFIVWTQPKNGYKSISFSLGLFLGITNIENIVKDKLLLIPYSPLDGLNEHGLGISVLVAQQKYSNHQTNPTKLNISTTIAMRAVLDHCKTTEEAIQLFDKYNMHDIDISNSTSFHFFITDNNAKSAVIEYVNNEMKVIRNHEFNFSDYVYVTNFYLNKPIGEDNKSGLNRYKILEEKLQNDNLRFDPEEAMDLLKNVSQTTTVWSNVYNTKNLDLLTSYNHSYSSLYKFNVLEPMKYKNMTGID